MKAQQPLFRGRADVDSTSFWSRNSGRSLGCRLRKGALDHSAVVSLHSGADFPDPAPRIPCSFGVGAEEICRGLLWAGRGGGQDAVSYRPVFPENYPVSGNPARRAVRTGLCPPPPSVIDFIGFFRLCECGFEPWRPAVAERYSASGRCLSGFLSRSRSWQFSPASSRVNRTCHSQVSHR